jgi:hypothetical protein
MSEKHQMQFYNFTNDETYHYFKWVTESGQADPDELIQRAFARLEEEGPIVEGIDISYSLKKVLVAYLDEILEQQTDGLSAVDEFGLLEPGNMRNTVGHPLLNPILQWGVLRIRIDLVAEALLIRSGKWAPGRDRPEFEGPSHEEDER